MQDEMMQVPPSDLQTEQAVLGAVLLGQPFESISELVSEYDFYLSKHQKVFAAMRRLWVRNEAIDVLAVSDEVERVGGLDIVGGRAGIAELLVGASKV